MPRGFTTSRAARIGGRSFTAYDWLLRRTADLRGTKFAIMTHHAPSRRSVPERFETDALSPAYASHLDSFVERSGAAAWIHGHIHTSVDYHIGQPRVISNPRGYPEEREAGFDPTCMITI